MYRILFDRSIYYYMWMKNVSPKIRGKIQLMLAQYKSLNVKTRQSRKHISSYNCRSHLGLDIWWLNLHAHDMWFRLHPFEMNFNRFYSQAWCLLDIIQSTNIYSTAYDFGTLLITILWHHTSMKWSIITIEWKC